MAMEQKLESPLQQPAPLDAGWKPDWETTREVRLVDTDATGQVHFAAYLRMMEEAEYAFLRSRQLSVVIRDQRGTLGFPRLHAEVDIHQPLGLGEVVRVELQLAQLDAKSLEYRFRLINAQADIAITGRFLAACCRFPDNAPPYAILIPSHVMQALQNDAPIPA